MEVLNEILSNLGVESVEDLPINDPFTVTVEGYQDLTIEKFRPDRVAVGHYSKQNGDLMSDPEVRFDVEDGDWVPVTYRNDPLAYEHDEDGLDLPEFLETWERNLRRQGFVEAASHSDGADAGAAGA